jgi:hypothetical protein
MHQIQVRRQEGKLALLILSLVNRSAANDITLGMGHLSSTSLDYNTGL